MKDHTPILVVFALSLLAITWSVVRPMLGTLDPLDTVEPVGLTEVTPTQTGTSSSNNSVTQSPTPTNLDILANRDLNTDENLRASTFPTNPTNLLKPLPTSESADPDTTNTPTNSTTSISSTVWPETDPNPHASASDAEYHIDLPPGDASHQLRPAEAAHQQRLAAIDQRIATEQATIADLTKKLAADNLDPKTKSRLRKNLSKAQSNLKRAQSDYKKELANKPPPPPLEAFADVMANPKWRNSSTLGRAAKALAPNEFPTAMQQVDALGWNAEGHRAMNTMMEQWGRRDISAALAHAETYPTLRQRRDAVSRAVQGWAREYPEQAYQRLVSGDPEDDFSRRINVSDVFKQLAADNPQQTLQKVWNLEETSDQSRALGAALSAFESNERESIVKNWFQQTPDPDTQKMLARRLIDNWKTYEPDTAATFVQGIQHPDVRESATTSLISSWGNDDPASAIDWLWTQPADQQNDKNIGRVVSRWANNEPEEAANYINQFPPTQRLDPAVSTLARSIAKTEPAQAMEWANSMIDEKSRNSTTASIANTWIKNDPRSAFNYINTAPQFGDDQRMKLLAKATAEFHKQNP